MIANNYAVAGTTAILYNIELSRLFNSSGAAIYSGITDVGFRWKKHSDSSYNTVSVKTTNASTISNLNDLHQANTIYDLSSTCKCKRYTPYKGHIYPCRVLLTGLEGSTAYDIEGYYVLNNSNNPEVFNTMSSFSTLADTASITHTELVWDSTGNNVDAETKAQVTTIVSNAIADMIDIYSMFCPMTWNFRPYIYWNENNRATASSNMSFNGYNCLRFNVLSTAVHEVAHNHMTDMSPTNQKVIKFMEFATDVENATWKWQSSSSYVTDGHNYPVISSTAYDYMEDCLVAAACQASKS